MLIYGIVLEILLLALMLLGIKMHIKVLRNGSFALALIILILSTAFLIINFYN